MTETFCHQPLTAETFAPSGDGPGANGAPGKLINAAPCSSDRDRTGGSGLRARRFGRGTTIEG
ncbi:hypothetical protein [Sinisalibacter aestuarii]|uniref:Uncharacterized protein n=1 Tax=Sinisalibacter aestuarii TaxID=2949426 RepID=A0ABQ5LX65_9RHOB|nr:hypothetical protein [Sinisalibacter aestuarii]GKY89208.1 hypothetical protein STA1M1_30770 [Sinisalibacter aestuarii]